MTLRITTYEGIHLRELTEFLNLEKETEETLVANL